VRSATPAEIERWDELVAANPDGGHILQSRAWGEFKRQHGWKPVYLMETLGGGNPLAILVLQRVVPPLGRLWYLPKGPGVGTLEQLEEVTTVLRNQAPAFTVKLEPELQTQLATPAALRRVGLRQARHDVQITRATIIVDLRRDEDELLASFKPKTRYNIRLAARRGVTVTPVDATEEHIDVMYRLMAATRDRAGFVLRSREYFAGYWRLQDAAGQGRLFFASLDGTVLAGVFATWLGRKGWYKDGGSSGERSEVMAPHLLQWEVMRRLRARGVEHYDLVAVPPRSQLDESHSLYGLYRFKSGFSNEITEFVGTLDLVRHRGRHLLWESLAERAFDQWSFRVRHDLFY